MSCAIKASKYFFATVVVVAASIAPLITLVESVIGILSLFGLLAAGYRPSRARGL